ncbi:ABC transporter ATP-binding protein [Candidatus Bathycorpusculum sp.]|uniref:ABC transporter ATP-binding protein n=1 Tax=Candidatus Bathycorpusculum sp. TaxID=2994959 RepID=UPI00281F5553|nr:ABC transporter ATP-binding protein [Candidatus Termitimicrobium sp.]MCL2432203.1 ABC transporter ATP-binding protein [Candidatus Termitimicrobium sp.]
MQDYIYTENLCKNYGSVKAINNLNLNVRAGEVFGFLGPNGAGKTTTIRVLTTLTRPTSGYVSVGGYDIHDEIDKVKKVIGVVQQHLSLDRDLTVRENMEFHARIQHLSSSKRKQRIAELLEYVELTEYADKMIDTLSGGMKKKASIVCSLLHEPKLLFLDEPTVGLDAQARRRLWDLVRRLNKDGTTIFLTTHYIEEAEVLCDRVGIMHHGQLIAVDEPANLREKVGSIVVETLVDNKDTHYQFFANREAATNYVKSLPSEVKTVIIRESNLEDVFIEQTGEKVGGP